MIEDLGSRNGTWVNGARVVQRQALRDGDVVRIGGTEFDLPSEGAARVARRAPGPRPSCRPWCPRPRPEGPCPRRPCPRAARRARAEDRSPVAPGGAGRAGGAPPAAPAAPPSPPKKPTVSPNPVRRRRPGW